MPEIMDAYYVTICGYPMDRATGAIFNRAGERIAPPRNRRPKDILRHLQRGIDLGMMRREPSPQGFRYYAFESFFSLVEAPVGERMELVFAYDPEKAGSREGQARAGKEELETRYRAERKAEEQRLHEAYRGKWEAWAEERAQKAEALRLTNTARIVGGQLQCPHCSKTFSAQDMPLNAICKPEGCGRSFYLPRHLGVCEACARWQDIPEGQRHGVCDCGVFVWPEGAVR